MIEYTEGVCEDGAAILADGVPITISEVLDRLNKGEAFKAINPSLMRNGLDLEARLASQERALKGMAEIGLLIQSQDNRITDRPIFAVQQKKRVWGIDPDYHHTGYEWTQWNGDESITADKEKEAELDAIEDLYPYESARLGGWTKVCYLDTWEFVTACFTEKACNDYIASNGHNLNEPRIYAYGSSRNLEFRAVRDCLIAITQIEGEGEMPACDHDWVRIEGNPLVTNGAMCARCHQIAAASDVLKGCGE